MKRLSILLTIAIFCILGCGEDDELSVTRGDLNVSVTVSGFQPGIGAEIYTDPPSVQGTTDEFGSTLLTGLEVGSYEVFASIANVGTGKSVVNIQADALAETVVNIIPGVNAGLAPTISIILPSQPAEFSEGEEIVFSATVEDDETPSMDLQVTWESDIDGIINSSPADVDGNLSFSTNTLSRGVHTITLTVEDADGYNASASIDVSTLAPSSVILLEPTKSEGTVILDWTEYIGSDFQKYEIFRTNGNCSGQSQVLLAEVTSLNETTYIDELPPLEFQVCYFIRVTNTELNSRDSNQEVVDSPSGQILDFEAYDMLKHPTQDYIYLLDQGGQRLVKYNYTTLEIINETSLQGVIGYCNIGDNGFGIEIYCPSEDGWIYIYDADNLSLITSINTGLPTASVVINGLGHVIASVEPSPWWEQPVRTYSRSSGIHIDGDGGFDRDRLRMIPGTNEIISISTGVSPVDMEYFKLGGDGSIEIHQDDQYHGDHPLDPRIFRISNDGTYVMTSRDGAVYTANSSMEYRGQLQHGSLEFSDFAFSDDGSIIYAATSNRKSIQIGQYPSLVRDDEILIKGYPVFIIRDGEKIISLSKSEENSVHTGVEVIHI